MRIFHATIPSLSILIGGHSWADTPGVITVREGICALFSGDCEAATVHKISPVIDFEIINGDARYLPLEPFGQTGFVE